MKIYVNCEEHLKEVDRALRILEGRGYTIEKVANQTESELVIVDSWQVVKEEGYMDVGRHHAVVTTDWTSVLHDRQNVRVVNPASVIRELISYFGHLTR